MSNDEEFKEDDFFDLLNSGKNISLNKEGNLNLNFKRI